MKHTKAKTHQTHTSTINKNSEKTENIMANEDNLKKYKKGQSGNPNGRPKKTITQILELFSEQGHKLPTAAEIRDTYLFIAIMSEEELKSIVQNKEQPMLMRICAQNILSKKGFEIIERMLDRAIGKAVQKTELSGNEGKPIEVNYDLSKLTVDELKQLREITTKFEGN